MADSRDVLLVDGYNMIGDWPELTRLAESGLEEARNRLLSRLADYQAFSGRRVIVVFDAYLVPGLGRSYSQSKVQIYFTKEKETADECIERLVRELSTRRRQIYVATSDMVEQHVIFGQGALRVSARSCSSRSSRMKKNCKSGSKKIRRNPREIRLGPS